MMVEARILVEFVFVGLVVLDWVEGVVYVRSWNMGPVVELLAAG
jgi:hypothetical protein